MGVYNANTNWNNERSYLNGLVSKGGGSGAWAKNQLKELDKAQKQYGGSSGGSTGGSTGSQPSTGGNTYTSAAKGSVRKSGSSGGSRSTGGASTPATSAPAASGSADTGPYNANTNWANENSYLNGLISKGGGTADWAKKQLQVLQEAQKKYTGGNGSVGSGTDDTLRNRYFPGSSNVPNGLKDRVDLSSGTVRAPNGDVLNMHDWASDTTDYGQKMLDAKDIYEFRTAAQARANKAGAQGLDISGNGGIRSNDDIYREWQKKTGYDPSYGSFVTRGYGRDSITGQYGIIDNAGTAQGYYGMDGEGHWGYYEDAALTKKLANGRWDNYASSDGGYVRMDPNYNQPDMKERDLSRAGKTVVLTSPKGTWECTYDDGGYMKKMTKIARGYTPGLIAAKADNDAGVRASDLPERSDTPWHTSSNRAQGATRADYEAVMASRGMSGGSGSGASGGTYTPQSAGSRSLPDNFVPSAAGVRTNNDYQEALREKMNENSRLWYDADDAERERLHQENVRLANEINQIGGNVSYDSASGKWSGSAGLEDIGEEYPSSDLSGLLSGSSYGGSTGGSGSSGGGTSGSGSEYDLSEWLKKQYESALEGELAGLKDAYEKNTASLDDEEARLSGIYDPQRNRIAAQNALAKRVWDERAAANGLSSGASGQAELARSSTMARDLASVGEEEANAYADVSLRKKNLTIEYTNAIAQAKANGQAELAKALYNELVRVQGLEREDQIRESENALKQAQAQMEYELALKQMEADSAAASQTTAKPSLTASQAYTAYKNGIRTDEVMAAMQYYYGIGGSSSGSSGSSGGTSGTTGGTSSGGTTTTTPSKTTNTNKTSYDNGGLTSAQIKQLQQDLNKYLPAGKKIAVDGYWGPATKAAAGGATAKDYYYAWLNQQQKNNGLVNKQERA